MLNIVISASIPSSIFLIIHFPSTIEPGEALTEIPPGIISLYDDILQVEKGNDQNIAHYKVCCANDMNR